jgi:hypothetical protein
MMRVEVRLWTASGAAECFDVDGAVEIVAGSRLGFMNHNRDSWWTHLV